MELVIDVIFASLGSAGAAVFVGLGLGLFFSLSILIYAYFWDDVNFVQLSVVPLIFMPFVLVFFIFSLFSNGYPSRIIESTITSIIVVLALVMAAWINRVMYQRIISAKDSALGESFISGFVSYFTVVFIIAFLFLQHQRISQTV